MALDARQLGEMRERRSASVAAIVESTSDKKLVVAGPGTGKSYTFQAVLSTCDGKGLALTFIRNLVVDLTKDLGELAHVFTFHGFCHHWTRKHEIDGLARGWHYYPPLPELLVEDLRLLDLADLNDWELGRRFHTLDHAGGVIDEAL